MDQITLKNPYISSALTIALIAYAGLAGPKLPEYIVSLFDYSVVKFIVFFLIAYMAKFNVTVAIVSAIAVLVTLQTLSNYRNLNKFASLMDIFNARVDFKQETPANNDSQNENQNVDLSTDAFKARDDVSEVSAFDDGNQFASV